MNGDKVLKRYSVEAPGYGSGTVWATTARQARYEVVKFLIRRGESVPFILPVKVARLWGARGGYRAGVNTWQDWNEQEAQEIEGGFNTVSSAPAPSAIPAWVTSTDPWATAKEYKRRNDDIRAMYRGE